MLSISSLTNGVDGRLLKGKNEIIKILYLYIPHNPQINIIFFSILKGQPLFSAPIINLMASSTTFVNGGSSLSFPSQRLLALAQQLRHYKPPPCSLDEESVTPVVQNPEKFRPKRAAVLICLFEGDAGDLRVILTKRSLTMSTHSGQFDSIFWGFFHFSFM